MAEAHAEHKDDAQFIQSVSSLKKTEDEAKAIIAKANENAEAELREAREKADEIAEGAHDDAVKLKDKLLLESKKGIESEQGSILRKAEKEAADLEKKKVKPEDIRKIAMSVLE